MTLVPIIVWVASRVLESCSAYSLNVTAANSWARRSRAFLGGTKYSVHSKICLPTVHRADWEVRNQPGSQISSMKLGKKCHESIPHCGIRFGLTPGGSSASFSMTSGLSQGPNSPLRSTWSIGLTIDMSEGGA